MSECNCTNKTIKTSVTFEQMMLEVVLKEALQRLLKHLYTVFDSKCPNTFQ